MSGNTRRQQKVNKALFDCIYNGDITAAAVTLNRGAMLEAVNEDGNYPLHEAILARCYPIIRLLIAKGANLYSTTQAGMTVQQLAATLPTDSSKSILLLLQAYCAPKSTVTNILDSAPRSPIQVAQAMEPHLAKVEELANQRDAHAVFLDIEHDGQNRSLVLKVDGLYANSLAGVIGQALAKAGGRNVSINPASHPFRRGTQPTHNAATTATVKCNWDELNDAFFGKQIAKHWFNRSLEQGIRRQTRTR